MKVLVTGATGFIGNYVVKELLKQQCRVVATSINQDKASSYEWFSQVEYIPCDLNVMQENFFQFFQQPDLLIHLAWEGLPNYKDLFHLERNLFSNYQFLKNMIKHGLKALTVTGTCFEYGMQSGPLREDMEAKPDNPYGLAKDSLRKFLEQLQKKLILNLSGCAYFTCTEKVRVIVRSYLNWIKHWRMEIPVLTCLEASNYGIICQLKKLLNTS